MVLVSEVVHPKGLSVATCAQVAVRRDVHKESFLNIASKVFNRRGHHPSKETVRVAYKAVNGPAKAGGKKYLYSRCGRKSWKVTKVVRSFLLKRLRALRTKTVCTATTLQREVLRDMGVKLDPSTIRKVLKKSGYKWLRRAQKVKHSAKSMKTRLAFAESVCKLSPSAFRAKLSMAMDGIVLSIRLEVSKCVARSSRVGGF